MEQDFIREEVKKLKKDKKINYAYFSRKLQISINSFYNFMCGSRNLSQEKIIELKKIIRRLEKLNYKNLLENKYDIQKIIYLLEFEKDLLEAELVSIELGDNNDFNRLERYLQLSTIYRFCENQIQALKKQESESETKMYQDLYMQQNGNNYSDKEWWGIVL